MPAADNRHVGTPPRPAHTPEAKARRVVDAVPTLYHFTCSHFELPIRAIGAVIPHRHPFFPTLGPVAWFTSEERPDRFRVGLTSDTLACDRMAHRFRVTEPGSCLPWAEVRDLMRDVGLTAGTPWQPGFDAETLRSFEYGRAVFSWWVSPVAVPVEPA